MEETKDEIRYCFTKYVETALKRARRDYLINEQKKDFMEEMTEPDLLNQELPDTYEDGDSLSIHTAWGVSWNAGEVSAYLKSQVDDRMEKALSALTEDELLIVFAKVFRQMTFGEIGKIMGRDWQKVASSYSYARRKMKKGWEQNGV